MSNIARIWKVKSEGSELISALDRVYNQFELCLFMVSFRFKLSGAARNFYWGGGAKDAGVWGGATENFSLTTPSTLAINVTNFPFIG